MSGHSFGGQTTQAVSGQTAPGAGDRLTDSRVDAALVLSPSVPARVTPAEAFGAVAIPWMTMTGTADLALVGDQTPESRRRVFPALPPAIDRYGLILKDAEHAAFADAALADDRLPRNPNHHRAILALSTAFWDAHLKGNPAARAWLQGEAARSVLEEGDQWRAKAAAR